MAPPASAVPPSAPPPRAPPAPMHSAIAPMDVDVTATPPLRFDSLPDIAVETIVRLLSQRPHLPSWRAFVPPDSAYAAMLATGSLRRVARASFPALRIEETYIGSDGDFRGMLAAGPSLTPAGIARDVRIVQALAGTMTSFRLARFPKAIEFTPRCARLRHLSLTEEAVRDGRVMALLAAHGDALDRLDVNARELDASHIAVIAKHCRSIRRLQIRIDRTVASLEPIWQAVGGRLQDLELGRWLSRDYGLFISQPFDFKLFDVKEIREYCENISCLRFFKLWGSRSQKGVGKLCMHFGEQLKEIFLEETSFRDEDLQNVLKSCPNAVLNLDYSSARTAIALGERALCFYGGPLRWNFQHGENMELDRVGAACPNITMCQLRLKKATQKTFRQLFLSPKKRLVDMRLFIDSEDFDSMSSVLLVLAESCVSLEAFQYSGPAPGMPLLEYFLRGNARLTSSTRHSKPSVLLLSKTFRPCLKKISGTVASVFEMESGTHACARREKKIALLDRSSP